MKRPFQKHNLTELEQARADYSACIEPAVLDDIIARSLEQYGRQGNYGVEFDTLVDMKVMKIIQDDIERMTNARR